MGRSRGTRCRMPAVRLVRVKGPDPDDCDFSPAQSGKDGYGPISTAGAAEFAYGRAPLGIGPLADGAIGAGRARAARVRHAAVREGLRHGSRQDASVRSAVNRGCRSATSPVVAAEIASLAVSVPADQICLAQLKVTVGRTRGRFGLSAGYQTHSLNLRHLNLHNISRDRCGTRTSQMSARGCAWVRGPTLDLSMRNGPTKTFDDAHQFHFSRLT